ncbi:type VI secretion system protein TssL, long form [Massilia sp. CCM 9210]|uniref:type VI secretion system protein TssL, long form n=1 Tax=Massilia scottii TaxID=3057166 RepID=UPI002796AD7E|nr:type VI secretion system protein TssL, long form [Massilia sp. CCM 9210]MDQ1816000.1 type VI secretion system protein TssL, long form [Massilia sp. CCM 9210]
MLQLDKQGAAPPDWEQTVLRIDDEAPRRARTARTAAAAKQVPLAFVPGAQPFSSPCWPNTLVGLATPLLEFALHVRASSAHVDLSALRQQLLQAMQRFAVDAGQHGIAPATVAGAQYCLCTLLDETISGTAWGGNGAWASHSLLVHFHNEGFGGEKFFLILQKLCQDPQANLALLELMYLCLALGLEGRYRVIDGGQARLDTIRQRLQVLIRKERGACEPALSPDWQAQAVVRPPARHKALALVLAAMLAVLLGLGGAARMTLDRSADPVAASLAALAVRNAAPAVAIAPVAAAAPRLASLLAADVERGLLSVTDGAGQSTIVLHGEGVFASGSADVAAPFLPLLERVAGALAPLPGRVLVIGHTDDVKSASPRFPSNQALSGARAATVAALLAARAASAERFTAQGRGESAPLVPNDSAANRARNRRVVIILARDNHEVSP